MAAVVLLSHLADTLVWESVRDPRVNDRDWGRFLRSVGYVPTWLFGAAALALASRVPAGTPPTGLGWRATALVFGPALGGGVAELVKLVVRRQRPGADSVGYLFRPFDVDLWSTRGLGFVSSHTAVAFGAAAILTRCFPATRVVWLLLASGCAATRLLAGAHYLSDVVGGAVVGWLVADGVWRWCATRARRVVAPTAL
jgi:membrane-associated phospholipid phosphatase